ncbi:hypothetical protein F2Q69_00021496 [Brassica cretica]|uniref:Uncharacterized protein n=1 Tax=Brassica cretica TaxID=69181 RepID=A0A8S9QE15_BRACR|nr:hypothetical protein F2Q69_00021496 [Brassica cretica]
MTTKCKRSGKDIDDGMAPVGEGPAPKRWRGCWGHALGHCSGCQLGGVRFQRNWYMDCSRDSWLQRKGSRCGQCLAGSLRGG